jgi:hypothetical protein
MATSGSYNFTLNRDGIIQEALENCRVITPGEVPESQHTATAARSLQVIVKEASNKGIRLWALTEKTQTVTGTSAFTPSSANGSEDTEVIGILDAFIRDSNNIDTSVKVISLTEYNQITSKADTGEPELLAFDYKLAPKFYLYPWPGTDSYSLHYIAERKLEDFDKATDEPDFGSNCLAYLIWELSYRLSFKFPAGLNENDKTRFQTNSKVAWAELKQKDKEPDNEFIEGAY